MGSVAERASPGEVPEPLRILKEGSAIDNIYDEMTSFSALCKAHKEIANGAKADALRFEYDLETNLHDISDDLRCGMVPKVSYRSFYVYVPKTRKVIYVDYTSKVIQRAVYDTITPRLVKGFISDTYACIPGRGQLAAMLRVSDWMSKARRSPDVWYYFKFDIHKFFYRIDHDILIAQLEKKFGDERLMDLISYYVDDMRTPFGIPKCSSLSHLIRRWASIVIWTTLTTLYGIIGSF